MLLYHPNMDVSKERNFVDEKDRDSDDSIPLADDDATAVLDEDDEMSNGQTDAEKRADRSNLEKCSRLQIRF